LAIGLLGLLHQCVSLGNGNPALFPEAHSGFPERFYVLLVVFPWAGARDKFIDTAAGGIYWRPWWCRWTEILCIRNTIVVTVAIRC